MKRRSCMSFLALSLLVSLAAIPASAQVPGRMRADIPFDFYVGGKLLPAGKYNVERDAAGRNTLRVRRADGDETTFALTIGVQGKQSQPDTPRLIFHRYGDQIFLAQVWESQRAGHTLVESKRERSLRKELRASGVASARQAGPEVLVVAARYEGR